MPSTTTFRRGEVIVVNVAFSDASGAKPRPALVVSPESFHRRLPDVIVCPISSQPKYHAQPGAGDHPLRDWRRVGLRSPSTVRVSKLLAVDKTIVKRTLGALSGGDMGRVDAGLQVALGLTSAG